MLVVSHTTLYVPNPDADALEDAVAIPPGAPVEMDDAEAGDKIARGLVRPAVAAVPDAAPAPAGVTVTVEDPAPGATVTRARR